jgi:hypothetical protein
LALCASLLLCAGAFVGTAPTAAAEEPGVTGANIEPAPADSKPGAPGARGYSDKLAQLKAGKNLGSEFRCWQGGQMIFETRGMGPLPTNQVVADLKSTDGSGGRVQVLDMYEGLCILELPK